MTTDLVGQTPRDCRNRATEREGSQRAHAEDLAPAHHVPADVCTFEWVRRRRYRSGITAHVLGRKQISGAKVGGVPLPLLRRTAVLAGKVAVARTVFQWSDERRSWLEMELAESRGGVKGYRMLREMGTHGLYG